MQVPPWATGNEAAPEVGHPLEEVQRECTPSTGREDAKLPVQVQPAAHQPRVVAHSSSCSSSAATDGTRSRVPPSGRVPPVDIIALLQKQKRDRTTSQSARSQLSESTAAAATTQTMFFTDSGTQIPSPGSRLIRTAAGPVVADTRKSSEDSSSRQAAASSSSAKSGSPDTRIESNSAANSDRGSAYAVSAASSLPFAYGSPVTGMTTAWDLFMAFETRQASKATSQQQDHQQPNRFRPPHLSSTPPHSTTRTHPKRESPSEGKGRDGNATDSERHPHSRPKLASSPEGGIERSLAGIRGARQDARYTGIENGIAQPQAQREGAGLTVPQRRLAHGEGRTECASSGSDSLQSRRDERLCARALGGTAELNAARDGARELSLQSGDAAELSGRVHRGDAVTGFAELGTGRRDSSHELRLQRGDAVSDATELSAGRRDSSHELRLQRGDVASCATESSAGRRDSSERPLQLMSPPRRKDASRPGTPVDGPQIRSAPPTPEAAPERRAGGRDHHHALPAAAPRSDHGGESERHRDRQTFDRRLRWQTDPSDAEAPPRAAPPRGEDEEEERLRANVNSILNTCAEQAPPGPHRSAAAAGRVPAVLVSPHPFEQHRDHRDRKSQEPHETRLFRHPDTAGGEHLRDRRLPPVPTSRGSSRAPSCQSTATEESEGYSHPGGPAMRPAHLLSPVFTGEEEYDPVRHIQILGADDGAEMDTLWGGPSSLPGESWRGDEPAYPASHNASAGGNDVSCDSNQGWRVAARGDSGGATGGGYPREYAGASYGAQSDGDDYSSDDSALVGQKLIIHASDAGPRITQFQNRLRASSLKGKPDREKKQVRIVAESPGRRARDTRGGPRGGPAPRREVEDANRLSVSPKPAHPHPRAGSKPRSSLRPHTPPVAAARRPLGTVSVNNPDSDSSKSGLQYSKNAPPRKSALAKAPAGAKAEPRTMYGEWQDGRGAVFIIKQPTSAGWVLLFRLHFDPKKAELAGAAGSEERLRVVEGRWKLGGDRAGHNSGRVEVLSVTEEGSLVQAAAYPRAALVSIVAHDSRDNILSFDFQPSSAASALRLRFQSADLSRGTSCVLYPPVAKK
ncbi:hypothetical protein DIPPA_22121 [Diplonema papillatum]|nr:hypothetical protein DIPPA_22121 [Diplonema papillatum]|eukprot:gene17268-26515_t